MTPLLPTLAHQGGWDELLWFAMPIAIAVMWVRWAEKRGRRARSQREGGTGSERSTIAGDRDT